MMCRLRVFGAAVQVTVGGGSLHAGGRTLWRLSKEDSMDPTNDPVKSRGGNSSESSQPIRFAGSVLDAKRHVCAFFHSPDEEYRVLLPFIKEGFERGEKAFHIVDPK